MKITVSFVANMFLAIFIAILPYISLLRSYFTNNTDYSGDDFILKILIKDLVISIIVYAISLIGYTIAETKAKENYLIKKISIPYFSLLFATVILQLIIGILSSILPDFIISNSVIVKGIVIFGLSIWTTIVFYKFSKKSVLFLIPIFIWFMYIYFMPTIESLMK